MTVLLWDIDGTLIRGRGGRVTMNAFVKALRLTSEMDHLEYPDGAHGKTDSQIALEVLAGESMDEPSAREVLRRFGPAYLAGLHEVREELSSDIEILPGVPELLEALRTRNVTQSLLTGNLQPVARLKLGLAGLDHFFDFDIGAFGSDHHDRTELVPIVRERLRARGIPGHDIVVVGDTPRDIACARAGGARAVAVATGIFGRDELAQCNPDAIFDDLSPTPSVIATLLRYSTYSDQQPALIV